MSIFTNELTSCGSIVQLSVAGELELPKKILECESKVNSSRNILVEDTIFSELLVCPLPSLLVAIFASAEVGFESLRQTIFLTCRMLSERKILSSV